MRAGTECLRPSEIETASFQIIDSLLPPPRRYEGYLWEVARRMIHTAGDISILENIELTREALDSGISALLRGCTIYTDTEMAACGIPKRRLTPFGCTVTALMRLPGIEQLARARNVTRSRMGIEMIQNDFAGAILVIGNAPTALFALLECLQKGACAPALIIGMPVGFVQAKEAKDLLHRTSYPHFTLLGMRGGSALAASCVNALLDICLRTNGTGL